MSAVLHFLLVPLLVALFALPLLPMFASRKPLQEIVTVSSAIRLEKHSKPEPQRVAQQPRRVRRVEQRLQPHRAARNEPAVRREVAVVRPRPEPKPQPEAVRMSAQELQREQQAFERTIAQARTQTDPVTSAARPVPNAASEKRYPLNIQGDPGEVRYGEGILTPVKRWVDAGYAFYYVRYSVIYPDGATEEGIVPWPIHFALDDDPFARGIRHMPLPGPGEDYTATTTADMQPLVKNCYDHRFMYCPISRESEAG